MIKRKDRTPKNIDLFLSEAGIIYTVHRHIFYPDTWVLSCEDYFDKEDLNTDDINEAVNRATEKMLRKFRATITKLSVAVDEIESSIIEKKGGEQ